MLIIMIHREFGCSQMKNIKIPVDPKNIIVS